MLPINYGSFYTLAEKQTAKFNFYKPVIKLISNSIFCFSIVGFIIAATGYGTTFLLRPTQNYNADTYQTANSLSDKVSKSLSTMRAARPQDINVCAIVDQFLKARPEDVSITQINVKPERYTVKGCASSVDRASAYSQAVLFGNRKLVNLNDVKTKNDIIYWTIDVTTKQGKETNND